MTYEEINEGMLEYRDQLAREASGEYVQFEEQIERQCRMWERVHAELGWWVTAL